MQNNVSQPLFAPASQSQPSMEDFDLGEVFAEYFINEFDDPMNAYTSSMANYSGTAVNNNAAAAAALGEAMAAAGNAIANAEAAAAAAAAGTTTTAPALVGGGVAGAVPMAAPVAAAPTPAATAPSGTIFTSKGPLPTGGIKTAFHMGVSQPSTTSTVAPPAAKKAKQAEVAPPTTAAPVAQPAQQFTALSVPTPLGNVTLPAAPVPVPNNTIAASGGVSLPPPPSLVQPAAAAPVVAGTPTTPSGVPLPVGVGIRLGGAGGVAPVTAQSRPAAMVYSSQQFATMRGAGAGGGAPLVPSAALAGGRVPANHAAPAGMSEQAIAERRQRNREHAKRSRVRKKFMLESLQEQVRGLQKENNMLRMLVQEHIPEKAMQIISECCASSPLFEERMDIDDPEQHQQQQAKKKDAQNLMKSDFNLIESLTTGQQCFVLSDPKLPDNPIVFATPGFYKLTGYTSEQVLGRNCRFLQGPGTNPRAVEVIRKAIAAGADATVCLLNYKADGTPFWNQFFIAALRDSDNCIVNYVGVQTEVEPESGASALEEKVNAVLPLQNKEGDPEAPGAQQAAAAGAPPVAAAATPATIPEPPKSSS